LDTTLKPSNLTGLGPLHIVSNLPANFRGDLMKRLWLMGTIAILFVVAVAQDDTPPGFEHWTPTSLKHFADTLHAGALKDTHHAATELLGNFSNDSFMLAHREGDGQAEWHETQADVFLVQSGSATLLVGGTLENGQTVSLNEKRGPSIKGGIRVKLSAGDIVRIPAKVPHQLLLEGAPEFTYFVVKIKGY
jgi:mannose-6-phosphate isomerase-like protein (cupin superfamily)